MEYSRDGRLIKGAEEEVVVRSKYEEDVHINNHTAVWGSYWQDGRWGYACCHSLTKNSYCTGKAGIEASKAALNQIAAIEDVKKHEDLKGEAKPTEDALQRKRKYQFNCP